MSKRDIEVVVMGRQDAEEYTPGENEVCISIRSHNPNHPQHGDSDKEPVLSDKFVDVLRLQVDDVDPERFWEHGMPGWNPMTDEEAMRIREFAEKHMNTKKKMIVHCYYGVSRSRSTAAALCDQYFLKHDFIVYNHYVYNKVRNAFRTKTTT